MKPNSIPHNKLLLCTLATAGVLISASAAAGSVYYVSGQNGNDSWSGLLPAPNSSSTDGPLNTLSQAQARMRTSSVKTVNVRAGTYSIASSLELTSADNGEQWIAYPGETAVLDGGGSGGVNVTNVNNLGFDGLTFRNMGGSGIYINFAHSLTVRRSNFSNCSQSCIAGGALTNSIIDGNTMNGQNDPTFFAVHFWTESTVTTRLLII